MRSLTRSNKPDELRQFFEDTLSTSVQMERLVTALLTLARIDSVELGVERARVDLSTLVTDAWRPFQAQAEVRRLHVTLHLPTGHCVDTDPVLFNAIATNLFSNAVTYAPDGGQIVAEILPGPGRMSFTVSNTAENIEGSDLEHVLDRFWKKDQARADSAHSGLGLSVVAALAQASGMTLEVELPEANRFRVRLTAST